MSTSINATTAIACANIIDDTTAKLKFLKETLGAFVDIYVDVKEEVYRRRAGISQDAFSSAFNMAIETLYDSSKMLDIAKSLISHAGDADSESLLSPSNASDPSFRNTNQEVL